MQWVRQRLRRADAPAPHRSERVAGLPHGLLMPPMPVLSIDQEADPRDGFTVGCDTGFDRRAPTWTGRPLSAAWTSRVALPTSGTWSWLPTTRSSHRTSCSTTWSQSRAYRRLTALPPDAVAVGIERPILHVTVDAGAAILHIINVHLKSKIPTDIPGQKVDNFTCWTADAWPKARSCRR